jgi:mRNA (guanine-N7-)-methyltransferase
MDNREKIATHYNYHANQHADFNAARQAREEGRALELKKFHNNIKRMMLEQFARGSPRLLDLCCGRGGDINKWQKAGVHMVKGLDISDGEILEAGRRYEETMRKGSGKRRMECIFEVNAGLGADEWSDGMQYPHITCMFALHYFYEQEATLKMFLHNVSLSLEPGGIFFGTVASGKRVLQLLNNNKRFSSTMLNLERQWEGELEGPFGNCYTCAISDTVTEGKGESEGSIEYLAFMGPMEKILATHGIYPVKDWSKLGSETAADRRGLEASFDPEDRDSTLKHFSPRFSKDTEPSLALASGIFGAFVFQKDPRAPLPAKLVDSQLNEGVKRQRSEGGEKEAAEAEAKV